MNIRLESGSRNAVTQACGLVQFNLKDVAGQSISQVIKQVEPLADRIVGRASEITKSITKPRLEKNPLSKDGIANLMNAVTAARKVISVPLEFDSGTLIKGEEPEVGFVTSVSDATESNSIQLVFIDASNVARSPGAPPDVHRLEACYEAACQKFSMSKVIMIADASLSRLVQNESGVVQYDLLNRMVSENRLVMVPPGTPGKADKYILNLAAERSGIVVSNDSFREFQVDFTWLHEPGRLFGHALVGPMGWQFTPRFPVRPRNR
jgi:hypothetical protein